MQVLRETDLTPKVEEYFARKGWTLSREAKVRGRTVDIVAVKGDEIAAVEVRGSLGGMQRGIEYALHQKNAVDLSYLAIPRMQASRKVKESCKNLGIGLLVIDDEVHETVKPEQGKSMPSVREAILKRGKQRKAKVLTTRNSLEKLFRSRAQILILKLLLLNSTSEFHLNGIARRTGLAPSTVAKENSILVGLGLIERHEQANLVFYRINKRSAIYDELKRIFLKYEFMDEVIKQQLPPELDYALIYGSFAKGKEDAGSDVDLLAIGKTDEDRMLKSISEAERKIGREINYNLWSKEEFREKAKNRIPLLNDILKTPIIMIVGDEGEFKRTIRQRSG